MTPIKTAKEAISNNSPVRMGLVITALVICSGGAYWAGGTASIVDDVKGLREDFGSFMTQRAAFEAEFRVRVDHLEDFHDNSKKDN